MLATGNDILNYIPQRHPFVMIDDLLSAEQDFVVTQFKIKEGQTLVEEGVFSESGLLENIAQTAAAHAGYFFVQKNLSVPVGYIANIKNLRIISLPPVNTILKTSVRFVNQIMNMALAEGEISVNGNVICTCEVRIYIKSDQSENLL